MKIPVLVHRKMMNRTNRTICKVAFTIPREGTRVHIGDFRLWRHPTNSKSGFTFLIQPSRASQYRNFVNRQCPANDNQACGQPPNIH